jgi:hypothetical protein
VESLPPDTRLRRFGRSFPLVPDFEERSDQPATDSKGRPKAGKNHKEMIESGMRWISNTYFPALVYPLLGIEKPGGGDRAGVIRANLQLVLLLSEIRDRQKHLSQILVRAFAKGPRGPTMFGGCYFAATGGDPSREQAFVQGVLLLLLSQQEFVSWTPEVFAEESDLDRQVRVGYTAIGLLSALIVAVLGYLIFAARS